MWVQCSRGVHTVCTKLSRFAVAQWALAHFAKSPQHAAFCVAIGLQCAAMFPGLGARVEVSCTLFPSPP